LPKCLHPYHLPHIHRKCTRCGHSWGETPIEADVGPYASAMNPKAY
jgi:hypothetical protein